MLKNLIIHTSLSPRSVHKNISSIPEMTLPNLTFTPKTPNFYPVD